MDSIRSLRLKECCFWRNMVTDSQLLTKLSILRWRILTTIRMLRQWVQNTTACLLCGDHEETINHLVHCSSITLCRPGKQIALPQPLTRQYQCRRWHGDHTKLHQGGDFWGLHWTLLGTMAWHIWGENNRRYKKHSLWPYEEISREIPQTLIFTSLWEPIWISPEQALRKMVYPHGNPTLEGWWNIPIAA